MRTPTWRSYWEHALVGDVALIAFMIWLGWTAWPDGIGVRIMVAPLAMFHVVLAVVWWDLRRQG